ncbi:glycosyltransferase family 1 protein [Haloarcula sp. Atlit-120R]|uniref:glycosyltransferase family 4 protein n=1 Tax=Haloarcula sp. Atlit-120R TaxID=2282135 RepID=UPI0013145E66|nr:glycosyltransferase family 1 protein [Haloarcula sp. Atlit-120R]
MRVGINGRALSADEPGGAIQASIKFVQGLVNSQKHEVIIFGDESLSKVFPNNPIHNPLYYIDSQYYGVFWERIILPKVAEKKNVDVLFSPNGNAPPFHTRFKNVMMIHDINAQLGMSSKVHQIYRKATVPSAAEQSDAIVTVSQFSKSEISEKIGIPKSKIYVIYNGIDNLYLSDEAGDEFELPDEYILYTGALNPRKNIQGAINGFETAKREYNMPHDLVIIGPSNKSIFKNMSVKQSGHIHTTGYISPSNLKYAYTNADLFLYPSMYEGFGLPPLEAMACGTPVVASDVSSFPEVLGDAAELVNPHSIEEISNAIGKVLFDNSYHKYLSNVGRRHAQKYTWQQAQNKMCNLMANLS